MIETTIELSDDQLASVNGGGFLDEIVKAIVINVIWEGVMSAASTIWTSINEPYTPGFDDRYPRIVDQE